MVSFRGIPGLSRRVELKLLDLLISQLDRELISHNVVVGDLQRRVDRVLWEERELLEASAELRGRSYTLRLCP